MKRVLVIGGTTFDLNIYLNEFSNNKSQTIMASSPLHETVGSPGIIKASNLVKLGVETKLHSVIGADEFGDKIINQLQKENVPFVYDLDPLGTKRYLHLINVSGEKISIFASCGSEQPVLDLVRLEQLIIESDLIVLNWNYLWMNLVKNKNSIKCKNNVDFI